MEDSSRPEGTHAGEIEGHDVKFLVDIGATLPLLNFTPAGSKTMDKIKIHGANGRKSFM